MHFLSRRFGWHEASFEDYIQAYDRFGGSTLANPRILHFFHTRHRLNETFFIQRSRSGELTGGVCIWDGKYIAGDQKPVKAHQLTRYPLNFDELVLPVSPQTRALLPFRTKFLSGLNHASFMNCSHRLNAGREISIVRPVSQKTRQSRNRELKRFLNSGGEVRCVTDYSHDELIRIYARLYFLRRGKNITAEPIADLLNDIPDLMFGKILTFNDEPCAMQWLTKSEDHQRVYLDYINAGMDLALSSLSVGTLAAWVNIQAAQDYCQITGKQMRFSFGRPTADYKARWCDREPLYRLIA
ncbi:GNAT family N-acetyltransferase [Trabulsiella odontotermitis]|uniref:GNAT family N-acetyltransferase n=1 Tax=Trabulsiella odontotermitis TaxID=379893 RepID=UPI0006BA6C6A|nr:GNAT family N-acetyltransferase [Trabulsiella odontotermitis]